LFLLSALTSTLYAFFLLCAWLTHLT